MPTNLTAYRIFIASPGGLQKEREAFKTSIYKYNETDALERGVHFVPVGWESTLGGMGRPQALINDDIRRCDFFIVLLWVRWGSRPYVPGQGPYTSGTEEEYNVAMECYYDSSSPMRQIMFFFKAVDIHQLSDPGPELSKVLDFRKKLESQKQMLFYTFDDVSFFEDKLRHHLATWVRDHEKGIVSKISNSETQSVEKKSLSLFMGELTETSCSNQSECTVKAERLANEGRYTEAEIAFAQAVVLRDDPDAMNRYGQFLTLMGRYDQAERILNMAVEWANLQNDEYWMGNSLNNFAALYYDQGLYEKALSFGEKAMKILEKGKGLEDISLTNSLDHIGGAYLALGRYTKAEPLFRRALKLREKLLGSHHVDYARGLNNLAGLYRAQKLDALSEPLYKQSLEIMAKSPVLRQNEIIRSLHGLGIIYYTQGRYIEAEPLLNRALEIITKTLEPEHPLVARSYHDLGMLYNSQGRFNEAEPLLEGALEAAEKALGPDHPNITYGLNGLAELYLSQQRYEESISLLKRALTIRERALGLEHPLIIPVLENMSRLYLKINQNPEAENVNARIKSIRKKTR